MNEIKVLIVEPNKEPYVTKIKNSLNSLQHIVGGLIDFIELSPNVDIIFNDEGKINNLPLNRIIPNDIVAGTFIVAGQHLGETISLTNEQIVEYKKYFELENDKAILDLIKKEIVNTDNLLGTNLFEIEKLTKRYFENEKNNKNSNN